MTPEIQIIAALSLLSSVLWCCWRSAERDCDKLMALLRELLDEKERGE